jgi:DNA-directed RNA polymerase specialized sigma24 family protein
MAESWTAALEAGDPDAAWDRFIERYRRLIFGAIRHYTTDPDDVMDAFARVCEALRENDFARLRRCATHVDPARPFSTWLVVVVRNLIIDWLRHRGGRPRLSAVAAALPPLQRRIFTYVFLEQRSHVETFELLRARDGTDLSFADFRRELRATYRAATAGRSGRLVSELALALPAPWSGGEDPPGDDAAVVAERQAILAAVLDTLPPDDRLAVQLYVVDDMPADQVARALGYPNAKAVYNRVYRALAAVRARLEQAGIKGGDL